MSRDVRLGFGLLRRGLDGDDSLDVRGGDREHRASERAAICRARGARARDRSLERPTFSCVHFDMELLFDVWEDPEKSN